MFELLWVTEDGGENWTYNRLYERSSGGIHFLSQSVGFHYWPQSYAMTIDGGVNWMEMDGGLLGRSGGALLRGHVFGKHGWES